MTDPSEVVSSVFFFVFFFMLNGTPYTLWSSAEFLIDLSSAGLSN